MIVAPAVSSTLKVVGAIATVETLAETGPGVKVIVGVLVKVVLLMVSVAEMILASALVDFMLAVVWPLALVRAAG